MERGGRTTDSVRDPNLETLAERIARFAPHDGLFPLRLPGIHVARATHPRRELAYSLQRPALCIVAQGAKTVLLGDEMFEYDEKRLLVYSVDLPVAARVVRASPEAPYLSLRLDLDPARIAELAPKVRRHGPPNAAEERAVCVAETDPGIVEAVSRLLGLLSKPTEADLIGPLVVEEIVIRLLCGPLGPRVARIGQEDSGLRRVGKAVSWMRENFVESMEVDALAGMVHMSASSFHQHFKAVTSLSPVQYQKVLRLQEARRLMLSLAMDAGAAGRRVGYASPSQFTREYGRYFGVPPAKDVARLRERAPLDEPSTEG